LIVKQRASKRDLYDSAETGIKRGASSLHQIKGRFVLVPISRMVCPWHAGSLLTRKQLPFFVQRWRREQGLTRFFAGQSIMRWPDLAQ
jgi:hypothetical protein